LRVDLRNEGLDQRDFPHDAGPIAHDECVCGGVAAVLDDGTEGVAVDEDLGADDIADVELAFFGGRKDMARDTDLRTSELVGAVTIVDVVELEEDRVAGGSGVVDGNLVLGAVWETDEDFVEAEEDGTFVVEELEA
jgi:hypothetical protein